MLNKIRSLFKTLKNSDQASHLKAGSDAELRAQKHLESNGFKTIATNVNSRFGEIDIVMTKDNDLLFVEVRYRSSSYYGSAAQSVHIYKQKKLINAARYFLQKNPKFSNHDCRFDVITIESSKNILQWHPCAFSLDSHRDYNL